MSWRAGIEGGRPRGPGGGTLVVGRRRRPRPGGRRHARVAGAAGPDPTGRGPRRSGAPGCPWLRDRQAIRGRVRGPAPACPGGTRCAGPRRGPGGGPTGRSRRSPGPATDGVADRADGPVSPGGQGRVARRTRTPPIRRFAGLRPTPRSGPPDPRAAAARTRRAGTGATRTPGRRALGPAQPEGRPATPAVVALVVAAGAGGRRRARRAAAARRPRRPIDRAGGPGAGAADQPSGTRSARRQRWPSRESSTRIPDAASSSRSRSEVAQSRASRALDRASRRAWSAGSSDSDPPSGPIPSTASSSSRTAAARAGVGGRHRPRVDPAVDLADELEQGRQGGRDVEVVVEGRAERRPRRLERLR